MPITTDVALDTNILLRTSFDEKSFPTQASLACAELLRHGYSLGTTVSNMAEFANSATRALSDNGLGLSTRQSQERIRVLESQLVVFSESQESYSIWKQLVTRYEVRGKQVHDTRIVSIMLKEGIRSLLTFNVKDFIRFREITVLHPDQVLAHFRTARSVE